MQRNVITCGVGDLFPGDSVPVFVSAVDVYPTGLSVEYRNTVFVRANGMSYSDIAVIEDSVTINAP